MSEEAKLTRGNSTLNPNYPANSQVAPNREKVEPIVKAMRRKRGWLDKIKMSFCDNEEDSIGDYILYDIIVPAVKSLVYDTICGGLELRLFGERKSRPSNILRSGGKSSYIPYNTAYYQGNVQNAPPQRLVRDRNIFNAEDIEFDDRGSAEEVLSMLGEYIDQYGMVTVAYLCEISGVNSDYTADRYGWTSIREGFTERVRNKYVIKLPRPKLLN